jgi:hypothetical protein
LTEVNPVSLYFVDTPNEAFDLGEGHISLNFAGFVTLAVCATLLLRKIKNFGVRNLVGTELPFSLSSHRKFRRLQVTNSWYYLSGNGLLLHSPLAISTQCHRMCS